MATNAALKANRPVLVFSLEMSKVELSQRILCSEARVDSKKIRNGKLTEGDWGAIANGVGRLAEAPIWIDDNPNVNVMEIRSKARRLKSQEKGLALIIVDYLQLMQGATASESRVQEISHISRSLKLLARDLDIPVMALSQLSRAVESRQDKRPILSDLRESGSIEQDADVVMFIYRDEYYVKDSETNKGIAELIVAKHRSGATDAVELAFRQKYTLFSDLARGEA